MAMVDGDDEGEVAGGEARETPLACNVTFGVMVFPTS